MRRKGRPPRGTDREFVLGNIEAGDVVFAIANDGLPKILLVYRTTKESIFARLVTSQTKMVFNRKGHSTFVDHVYTCSIVSAAPLPVDEYNVVRGLDRKMRLAYSPGDGRLTEPEKRLLVGIDEFYKARLLPEE
jgi:hypothetical protein